MDDPNSEEYKTTMSLIFIGSIFSILVNIIFFTNVIANIIWTDCRGKRILYTPTGIKFQEWIQKLQKKLFPKRQFIVQRSEEYIPISKRKKFFNLNMFLITSLQFYGVSLIIARFFTVFPTLLCKGCIPCKLQGIALHVLQMSQNILYGIVATWLFASLVFTKFVKRLSSCAVMMLMVLFHIFSWIIAALLLFLPMSTDSFDRSPIWCFIDRKKYLGSEWILISYYTPIWVIIAYVIVIYFITFVHVFANYFRAKKSIVQRVIKNKKLLEDERKIRTIENEIKVYSKLILLPLVFACIWIVPTISRVSQALLQTDFFILQSIHNFLQVCLQPTFIVVIYFINPIGLLLLVRKCMCCGKSHQTKQDSVVPLFGIMEQKYITSSITQQEFQEQLSSVETLDESFSEMNEHNTQATKVEHAL